MSTRSYISDAEHHELVRYIKDLRASVPEQVDPDSWITEGLISKGWIRPTPSGIPDPVNLPKNPWPFVVESDVDYD